ncbi:MAG: LytTR family DNA-binding domain-containing protein [Chitinophagaceae bacterium]
MSLRIHIVEDEQLGVERLEKHLLCMDPAIEIAGITDSVRSSIHWLQTRTAPDLIIMDIDLGDGQSFDIFNEVTVGCPVIFTTCYDEFALNIFKLNNIDYLLKPIKKEDLKELVDKFINAADSYSTGKVNIDKLVSSLQKQFLPKEFRQRFLVKYGRKLTSIETNEISYFYSDGQMSYVKTKDRRKLVVDHSLEELESMLNPKLYFRVNGFYLIAIESISKVYDYNGGCILLSLVPPTEIKAVIPRHKVREFKAWMADG